METKLAAIFAGGLKDVRVSELCAELGISRQSFYKWRRRWEAEGLAGLVERSRRPARSPGMIPAALEDEIVRLRKELPLDRGAQTIAYHLARSGWAVPSVATIHRALRRRGLVVDQPHKRPRSSWRRFEFERPNACWQIDATEWRLRRGRIAWIMDVLDDHSRACVAARVGASPTGELAWAAFIAAVDRFGLPARVLSDNGLCFTAGRTRAGDVAFERNLRALGVQAITSSPHHPQTCGKIERFHKSLKAWLRTQPIAATRDELQDQLDEFADFYNHHRPHKARAGATPHEAWNATEADHPGPPLPDPPDNRVRISAHRVSTTGKISLGRYVIGVGWHLAGRTLTAIRHGRLVVIVDNDQLVRRLELDPTRRYQPSGRPPGRRPRTPH